ncbi:transposase [Corallococcus coralloides]|nr:transposase [Corallococcus coralloides]
MIDPLDGADRRALGSPSAARTKSERQRTSAKSGRHWRDPRDVLNGILWVLRAGAPWADLPGLYPSYQTCHRRF